MEWKIWLDDHLSKKMSETKTKLRRIIYNLNGGDDRSFEGATGKRMEFYGCDKCGKRYTGIGIHFVIAYKDKSNTKVLDGLEKVEEDIDLLNETNMCGNTDRFVLCKQCYADYRPK